MKTKKCNPNFQGKLSVLSNPPPTSELEHALSSPGTNSPGSDMPTYPDLPDSVARDRKNGTFGKEKPGLVQVYSGTYKTLELEATFNVILKQIVRQVS